MKRLLPALLLAACAPQPSDPGCAAGLDADGDGVCDREAADWSAAATLPLGTDRANVYDLSPEALAAARDAGLQHVSLWPVTVSGALLPWGPMERFLGGGDPSLAPFAALARQTLGFGDLAEMYAWLGLPAWGDPNGEGPYRTPRPANQPDGMPMGAGLLDTAWGPALTFSCATCHVAELFGHTVVGLTNKRARANEFFLLAKGFYPGIPAASFAELTDATDAELALFTRTQVHLGAIGGKLPEALGLDTSLAQVALSLARRDLDADATRDPAIEASPRPSAHDTLIADSKPAVWWTLKHKTRWLSDGSIVAGNPIFTNFLWNELGRGTDLPELRDWLDDNQRLVDELTVAIFATEPPRWADLLGTDDLDVEAARRGEAHFAALCADCHGTYVKDWDGPDPAATLEVRYHEATPVLDVGTSPGRAEGMADFAGRLNELAISRWMQTEVAPQRGYVPPPLTGIWARYPYLHNQSVPTLCDLLRPAEARAPTFWLGPTADAATDFDATCVGYPVGDAVPEAWKADPRALIDTTRPGLSNQGHDAWLTDADGQPVLDDAAVLDLIAFLKTL